MLALPAIAGANVVPPNAEGERVALAAEIDRLCALNDEIYESVLVPIKETYQSLVDEAIAARDAPNFKELWDKAGAYS